MAPPAKSGGSGLTKKFGPLPAWGWIVVAIVAYYLYQKMSGGGGLVGSSSTASTGVAPPTATESFPGGYSYSGPASGAAAFQQGVLGATGASGGQGATSPGQGAVGTSPGSGAGTPGTFQGSGGGSTVFAMEGPNFVGRGPSGAYVGITNPQQAAAYTAQGTTLYTYAPSGGFQPLSAHEQGTIPGEFLQISSQPYGGVPPG
jgi:hypothetical protein